MYKINPQNLSIIAGINKVAIISRHTVFMREDSTLLHYCRYQ